MLWYIIISYSVCGILIRSIGFIEFPMMKWLYDKPLHQILSGDKAHSHIVVMHFVYMYYSNVRNWTRPMK